MSLCPPSAWKNSALTRQIFMKLGIEVFLEKPVEKIQISSKSGRNSRYFT
jgi:hypothetical protein